MGSNLQDEFREAISDSANAVVFEISSAIRDLAESAPQVSEEIADCMFKATSFMARGRSGELDPHIAAESAKNELAALHAIEKRIEEEGAREAVRKLWKFTTIALILFERALQIGVSAASGNIAGAIAGAVRTIPALG